MRLKNGERLEIALWAIATLPPKLKAEGAYHPATSRMPAGWELGIGGCQLSLAHGVLLLPIHKALSNLIDVWPDHGGKVLSVSWFPDEPWHPPWISCLKAGDWLYRLGWRGQAGEFGPATKLDRALPRWVK